MSDCIFKAVLKNKLKLFFAPIPIFKWINYIPGMVEKVSFNFKFQFEKDNYILSWRKLNLRITSLLSFQEITTTKTIIVK